MVYGALEVMACAGGVCDTHRYDIVNRKTVALFRIRCFFPQFQPLGLDSPDGNTGENEEDEEKKESFFGMQ